MTTTGAADRPGALPVGVDTMDGSFFAVNAAKMNRHTFWCGQSGSGKTYALGVLLEQLLLRTRLPLLVLDPNADFARLGETLPDAHPDVADRLAQADVRVFRPGGEHPLKTRFVDLSTSAKAAVLRMDPVMDALEYNAMLASDRAQGGETRASTPREMTEGLKSSPDPGRQALALRIENLQVLEWDLWAWGAESVTDTVHQRPPATVMDLSGCRHAGEAQVAALCVLEHLWLHRAERQPILVVIDEAHNLCPAAPATPVERALAEQIVQIAAEGRKYGIWLLLSTQRPTKIQVNVLTQCDNLALLRMNAPKDLAEIEDVFGFAPCELTRRSPEFQQGEVLFAGGFVPRPAIVKMGARLTHEGGADVSVPLRAS